MFSQHREQRSVYELDVPESIIINSYTGLPFLAELKDINLEPIVDIDGSFVKSENVSLNDYKNPVLRWQSENILANISTEEFSLKRTSGETEGIFRTYNIDVKSFSYPFGQFDDDCVKIIKQNYEYAVTTKRSRYKTKIFETSKIPRIPINSDTTIFKFLIKTLTIYEDIKFKS